MLDAPYATPLYRGGLHPVHKPGPKLGPGGSIPYLGFLFHETMK